ncbi:MAG: hypothetical protein H6622_06255 [Halobacteriovoraceae bacterium]|nr:hypothetical protein [Halobacteriovoraceae bacterium]
MKDDFNWIFEKNQIESLEKGYRGFVSITVSTFYNEGGRRIILNDKSLEIDFFYFEDNLNTEVNLCENKLK